MMDLGERKLRVLGALVESYITTGEPIGSKALLEKLGLSVSSATIRNDMAELVELGLLEQPHTSAGRIPSTLGYRIYIDHLMSPCEPDEQAIRMIDSMLSAQAEDPEHLIQYASAVLAELTQLAALSTTPARDTHIIIRCEMIVAERRVAMLVLLTASGIIRTRLVRADADLTEELTALFKRVSAERICGLSLADISLPFMQTLTASLGEHALAMTSLMIGVYEIARDAAEMHIRLEGQANILVHPDFTRDRARALVEFLNQRERVEDFLSRLPTGARVWIGAEAEHDEPGLSGSSVLVTHYQAGQSAQGTVAVIGPHRINYAKLIPSLEYFAGRLGALLSSAWGEENKPEKNGAD